MINYRQGAYSKNLKLSVHVAKATTRPVFDQWTIKWREAARQS